MTKNMACVMCHTDVNGNISGFGTLTFRDDSSGNIWGNIYAVDQKLQYWIASGGTHILNPNVHDTQSDPNLIAEVLPGLISSNLEQTPSGHKVRSGEQHNKFSSVLLFQGGGALYTLTHHDETRRQKAEDNLVINPFLEQPIIDESDFPALDVEQCKLTARGSVTTSDGQILSSPINSNLILVNGKSYGSQVSGTVNDDQYNDFDPACPTDKTLTINGEVVISGDLILSGCIKGQGSIYASGNIYVPDDIKVVNSAFPYSLTVNDDLHKQEAKQRLDRDMISLGASEFIIIGAIRTEVIGHIEQDPIFRNNVDSLKRVYSWVTSASGQANYEKAFLKRAYMAVDSAAGQKKRGIVARIDGNLYANKGVAITLTSSWGSNIVVNGSVITPNLSMLSTGFGHSHYNLADAAITTNPFNGADFNSSQLNQDYRLQYSNQGYECHRIRTF